MNTLQLPLYVVGGGLVQAWELLKPAIFEELHHRSYVYRLTEPAARLRLTIPRGQPTSFRLSLGRTRDCSGAYSSLHGKWTKLIKLWESKPWGKRYMRLNYYLAKGSLVGALLAAPLRL